VGNITYRNLDLKAFGYHRDNSDEHFQVYVVESPAGQPKKAEAEKVTVQANLRRQLSQLALGCLNLRELIVLGEALASLLFPPRARSFLLHSQESLKQDEGLRIRLWFCNYALADLPWEYVYIPRAEVLAAQEVKGPEGFLALNRRCSLVRCVSQERPPDSKPDTSAVLRLVMLSAGNPAGTPDQHPEIAPQQVAALLQDIFEGCAEVYPDATPDTLSQALVHEAQVVHLVGHGRFMGAADSAYDTYSDRGVVVVRDAHGQPLSYPADQFADRLGRGVRLAVLDADATDDLHYTNPWLGVVPALIRHGIPAVVGIQHMIDRRNAAAFYRRFYRALAKDQPLDAAIVDGRLTIFNRGSDSNCDWGAPALYVGFDADAKPTQARARVPQVAADSGTQAAINLTPFTLSYRRALRDVLVRAFNLEELEALCADVERYLADDGIVLQVNLEVVGGSSKAAKQANLFKYLDREGQLAYLLKAVRSARPGLI
jgi:hypothetical protein